MTRWYSVEGIGALCNEPVHDGDAEDDRADLDQCVVRLRIPVQFRDQIGPGDVKEIAGGKREEPLPGAAHLPREEEDGESTEQGGERGEEIEEERTASGIAAMEQDREVPELLRDLVHDHGDRRRQPQLRGNQV